MLGEMGNGEGVPWRSLQRKRDVMMRDLQSGLGGGHFLRGCRVGTSFNAPRDLDLRGRRELPGSTERRDLNPDQPHFTAPPASPQGIEGMLESRWVQSPPPPSHTL